jgi:Holliday junction DNA helicase RuvA
MILSSISPAELVNVIATGNERMLKSVKGIGLRTAQRIIVDLKDKVDGSIISDAAPTERAAITDETKMVRDEAVGALTMLGFALAPSAKVVSAILTEQPQLPVEQVVKLALKQIK